VRLFFALLLAFAAPLHAQEAPDWFEQTFLDVREDVAAAGKDGKRLMLYFWLEGCPYCKQLVETTFQDPKIVAKTRRGFLPVSINVRGAREVTWTDGSTLTEKELASLLQVRWTPTLVFFDEKARIAVRVSGYQSPEEFDRLLDRALAAP
jgi:thioredoxin-related protein